MKRPMIWLLIICAFKLEARTEIKTETLDSALTYLYERHMFNGTVLFARNGEVIYERSLGITGTEGAPLTNNSSFNLASVSKQFYTMMVMILAEQGKLDFDDAVTKHVPDFPYPNITIRHLMNQTSGLPEYFEMAGRHMHLKDTLTNKMLLDLLIAKKPDLVFMPGEKWQYSNTNYTTLASLVEKVSGMHPATFFDTYIASPLDLQNTYVYNLMMSEAPSSRVYGIRYEGGKVVPNDLVRYDGIMGDGNIYASARDLLKWDQALYDEVLVSDQSLKEAFSPAVLMNGDTTRYGFGWFIQDPGNVLSHTGGWVGFRTYIRRDIANKETLIILTNGSDGSSRRVVEDILQGNDFTLPSSFVIVGAHIIDGSGMPRLKANVRIVDGRIAEIGNLTPADGEPVINGEGKVLSPGFIDSHSHHDRGLAEKPESLAAISQGITTIIVGQDGGSVYLDTLVNMLKAHPPALNVATFTGHSTLRHVAMDGDVLRKASDSEIDKMKHLLEQELEKGSLGLSTGLEYESAFYSNTSEVIELAKTASLAGGSYISHIRSEDVHLDEAIDEIIDIGITADIPVQISHIKIARRSRWGTAPGLIAKLQRARQHGVDISADVYPYTMWSSTPRVLFPDKDFTSIESARFATRELFDPSISVMVRFPANEQYVGLTVTGIGELYGESPDRALLRIIREGDSFGSSGAIVATSMSEEDVKLFLRWPYTSICSDGAMSGHPRGHGAFTRVLGRYVRELEIMTLEEAIRKMTSLPAERMGITGRGLITPGYYADMVLFDPGQVTDNATISDPTALSSGISTVWVNGRPVFSDGQSTGELPGVFVRRPTN